LLSYRQEIVGILFIGARTLKTPILAISQPPHPMSTFCVFIFASTRCWGRLHTCTTAKSFVFAWPLFRDFREANKTRN